MRRLMSCLILLILVALPLRAETLTVFAAASLQGALDEVAAEYRADGGEAVVLSYAGSSVLARQIRQGAPADVFVSANPQWMEHLQSVSHIAPEDRVDLLGNRLVLVGHGPGPDLDLGDRQAVADRLASRFLAIAQTDAVPAGIYGRAALEHFRLWGHADIPLAQTDNVRAALALVASGAAPLGVVYATDARAEPRVSILARFPPQSHPAIRYPAAALSPEGRPFLRYLQDPKARAIFARHGFEALAP